MNILYCRVSSIDQNTDRQKVTEKDFTEVIEDKCSGSIPFSERPGGKQVLKYLSKDVIKNVSVWSIDRLGRDLRDIINVIHLFNEKKVCIHFLSQGLRTLDANGKENAISKMMISILGVVAEMEMSQIRERQLEGIKIAKLKGVYKGRVNGSKENTLAFLSKKKNKEALAYLKKGYKGTEIIKLLDIHINTITKVKRLGLNNVG